MPEDYRAFGTVARMNDAAATPHWEVWRQDDNGNRYLVSAHPDEAGARAFAANDPAMKANVGFACEIYPMRAVTRENSTERAVTRENATT